MSDQSVVDDGLGESTPGADEAERFREDLYLRIVGTAETMARILDGRAASALSDSHNIAADGKLHEDRMTAEMEAAEMEAAYVAEHSRFTYNWAHVMLTTRVVDALKTLSGHLIDARPKGRCSKKGEISRLSAEFADRFKIKFSKCPSGDAFLEGMVLARNKIVHNGAMAWEACSNPDAIVVEGTEDWSPSKCDRDFVARFPEYVDSDKRITVAEQLFKTNTERASTFVTWVCGQFDSFVQLLTRPSAGCSPS
jgi:hypothetical protein